MDQVVWRMLDRSAEIRVTERQLPHWDQTGALTFVTFRLADSLPKRVIERWRRELRDWLDRQGVKRLQMDAAVEVGQLPHHLRPLYLKFRKQRWHAHLDDCHGSCVLRDAPLARIVGESLRHFDGERYDLERFVVMPNHVHLLVQMRPGVDLRRECESWLRFTGRKINALLGRRGELWQSEPFDHVVRSELQFAYLRRYIADNPEKAGLREGEFLFWQRNDAIAGDRIL